MVCLLAAPWVQLSVSAGSGWPHNALWHHWLMTISRHFCDCKALLVTSLTHVSGAIGSVQTFTFTFTFTIPHNPCHQTLRSIVNAQFELRCFKCQKTVANLWLRSTLLNVNFNIT